jgi:hypothetical protein
MDGNFMWIENEKVKFIKICFEFEQYQEGGYCVACAENFFTF